MTCTVHQTGHAGKDEYGDVEYATTDVQTTCLLQQTSTTDDEGHVRQISQWRLLLPPEVGLNGWDSITVDGQSYVLTGDAWAVMDPLTRRVHHVEAVVERNR